MINILKLQVASTAAQMHNIAHLSLHPGKFALYDNSLEAQRRNFSLSSSFAHCLVSLKPFSSFLYEAHIPTIFSLHVCRIYDSLSHARLSFFLPHKNEHDLPL